MTIPEGFIRRPAPTEDVLECTCGALVANNASAAQKHVAFHDTLLGLSEIVTYLARSNADLIAGR